MIDTDKYEGHTPAPWYRMHSNNTIRSEPMGDDAEAYLFDIVGATTVDAELAADAPLLLEAYKRLRLVADELYLHIVGEPHMTLDELVAEMPWRNEE